MELAYVVDECTAPSLFLPSPSCACNGRAAILRASIRAADSGERFESGVTTPWEVRGGVLFARMPHPFAPAEGVRGVFNGVAASSSRESSKG